jgi:hypothetical protein
LGEVESHTDGEFKASVVGAYERGERAISVQRFVRLAEVYDFPPADLLPRVSGVDLVIDLDSLAESGNDQLAERYLNAIKMLRKEPGGQEVRHSDLAALGSILQSTEDVATTD